jgi:hypothetical protein
MIRKIKSKKGQEEMIGFVVIVLIVVVLLLIFLRFSLTQEIVSEENFEVHSFLQVYLDYTSDCEDLEERLIMRDLIIACNKEEVCVDGREACVALSEDTEAILEQVWQKLKPDTKAYDFLIVSETEQIFVENWVKEGEDNTGNSKSSITTLTGKGIDITLDIYY